MSFSSIQLRLHVFVATSRAATIFCSSVVLFHRVIEVMFRFYLARTKRPRILLAICGFYFHGFVRRRVTISHLVRPTSVQVYLFGRGVHRPKISRVSIHGNLCLSVGTSGDTFWFRDIPVSGAPLRHFFFFHGISVPFGPIFGPLPYIFPIFQHSKLVYVVAMLTRGDIRVVFLRARFLSQWVSRIYHAMCVFPVVPVHDRFVPIQTVNFSLFRRPK